MSGLSVHAQSDVLAVIETDLGNITLEFFPDDAPKHVENFINLAETGFYDQTLFHRIIPGFMIQGGDPNTASGNPATWGTGGPADSVDAEFNDIKHKRGILSMARSSDPNSAGSQFFIVHQDSTFLDGQYTVFGRIVTEEGFQTLDVIANVMTGARDVPVDPDLVRITKLSIISRSDASNILTMSDPERAASLSTSPTDTIVGDQRFESQEHKFAFDAPAGWLLQEPSDLGAPDVVAVGPSNDSQNPYIAIYVEETDHRTANEVFTQSSIALDEFVASGFVNIISQQDDAVVDGHPAQVIVAESVSALDNAVTTRFHQVLVHTSEKIYTITYANALDNFDSQLPAFEESLDSFVVLSDSSMSSSDDDTSFDDTASDVRDGDGGGGGCLIATAAIGSELSPQIQQLRELRDNTVLATESGSAFMSGFNQFYYSFSPAIADMERQNPVFKEFVKFTITPLLWSLSILSHVNVDSEAEMLGYGIGIILLIISVYVVVPIVIIRYGIKRLCTFKIRR